MPRAVSVYLPTWPTDRLRRKGASAPPGSPFATVVQDGSRRILAAVDEAARVVGLQPDMTVAHAQALVRDLALVEAQPEEDARGLEALARWCLRYSPVACADPPDGLFIDVGGASHLFGGEELLRRDLLGRLAGSGVAARVAVADTPGLAWGMARFGAERIVPTGRRVDALAGLPVAALRLPGEVVQTLRRLGLERVEQILGMPRRALLRRFGHSIVAFARSQEILHQGRGSAANSVVCYCLGITAIDPERQQLLFERFISEQRGEPPDIDIDIENDRREIVIQWVYDRYGRDRAALASTVVRYRARGAMTDVAKALGFSRDLILKMTRSVSGWSSEGIDRKHAAEIGLNLDDHRVQLALRLAQELIGTPRHLSQHPGGFVLARDRLDTLVPIEPARMSRRQVIEWDKDDLDSMQMLKVDLLGLGMLGALRRSFEFLKEHKGIEVDMASVPAEDPAVYQMIREVDTIGTFQVESRAQQQMAPRLEAENFEDLKLQIAIVRPGPIQGQMVHPLIRRRRGLEPYVPPTPEFDAVLGRTWGVPIYQEQVMMLAIHCAGFTPDDADALRRSMASFRFTGSVARFRRKFVDGMTARNYDGRFAESCARMIEGFASYGFPESHSASFALIAYSSAWMKRYHPDVFLAALINSQPMGFYPPVDLVEDAVRHGVEVRAVDVNHSHWDCTLEPTDNDLCAVRLGMRMVDGLRNDDAARIVAARGPASYGSVEDLWRRARVKAAVLKKLAEADAFSSMSSNRRQTDWAVLAIPDEPLPLFAAANERDGRLSPEIAEAALALPRMRLGQEVVADYQSVGLSLRANPVSFLRADLTEMGMISTAELNEARNGSFVTVAGLLAIRQMPESAHGVVFVSLKDENGWGQVIVWPKLFERQERLIRSAQMVACRGRVQREGKVVHLIADHVMDLDDLLRQVGERDEIFPVAPGNESTGRDRPAGDNSRKPLAVASGDPVIKVETRDFR